MRGGPLRSSEPTQATGTRPVATPVVLVIAGLLAMTAACEESHPVNHPPVTALRSGDAPVESLAVTEALVRWTSTDPDGDALAYQYRLLVGAACDTPAIQADTTSWIEVPETEVVLSFDDWVTHPEGPYVFQARAEDEHGARDVFPLTLCFVLSLQHGPVCRITREPTGHQGLSEAEFCFTAEKRNRAGDLVPFQWEYSWTFSQTMPEVRVIVPWTTWSLPASDTTCVQVPGLTPSYVYEFQLKVRDVYYPEIESEPCVVLEFEN